MDGFNEIPRLPDNLSAKELAKAPIRPARKTFDRQTLINTQIRRDAEGNFNPEDVIMKNVGLLLQTVGEKGTDIPTDSGRTYRNILTPDTSYSLFPQVDTNNFSRPERLSVRDIMNLDGDLVASGYNITIGADGYASGLVHTSQEKHHLVVDALSELSPETKQGIANYLSQKAEKL